MRTTILLTGHPGCGKTTVIQRTIKQLARPVGGFYTREIRAGGQRRGFEMVTFDGQTGILAHADIEGRPRVSKYGVDLAALDEIGTASIRRALARDALVVIDEIGPMELYSEAFQAAVLAALDGDVDVLGTIVQRSTPFSDRVKARPDVTISAVTRANRDDLPALIVPKLAPPGG
jgi:nucleoside-triphosphatase